MELLGSNPPRTGQQQQKTEWSTFHTEYYYKQQMNKY
jgi:hypothetical protein